MQEQHPVPDGCGREGNVVLWADELGRLLYVHDACADSERFFIGIACPYAFGGGKVGSYQECDVAKRKFPLVGPEGLAALDDALSWEIDPNLHNKSVSFEAAKENVKILGGNVATPKNGSHYKVSFANAPRSWPLDRNEDPLKDEFIKELVPITKYSFEVVKTVLLTGAFPHRRIKLHKNIRSAVPENVDRP